MNILLRDFSLSKTEKNIRGSHTQDVTHEPCTEKGNWTQNFTSKQNAVVTDTWWKKEISIFRFLQQNVLGYIKHTVGQATCPGIVGQHKTDVIVFHVYALFFVSF